jgi:hypothetical protein
MALAVLLCVSTFLTLLLAGLGWLYYRTGPASVRITARITRLLQLKVEIRNRS